MKQSIPKTIQANMIRSIFIVVQIVFALDLFGCTANKDADIVHAAGMGDVVQVQALLKQGAKIEAHAIDDWTPLTAAVNGGHLDIVKALLEAGANVNAMEGGGNTPLFWAAFGGHVEIVKLLLDRGADATRKCSKSRCQMPIEIARTRGHQEVVKVLSKSMGSK